MPPGMALAALAGARVSALIAAVSSRVGTAAVWVVKKMQDVFQQRHTVADIVQELGFLKPNDPLDEVVVFSQRWIGGSEAFQHRLAHLGHEGAIQSQLAAVTDGAADDAAQDVAAFAVGRYHAIADQERCGAGVLGNHPDSEVGFGFRAVLHASQVAHCIHDGAEKVGFVDVGLALQDGGGAFQPQPGINAGSRQGSAAAGRILGRTA